MATLKEQALIQRIGEQAMIDAEAIADLRVQLTQLIQQLDEINESKSAPPVGEVPRDVPQQG